jgi:hypothetical protein
MNYLDFCRTLCEELNVKSISFLLCHTEYGPLFICYDLPTSEASFTGEAAYLGPRGGRVSGPLAHQVLAAVVKGFSSTESPPDALPRNARACQEPR